MRRAFRLFCLFAALMCLMCGCQKHETKAPPVTDSLLCDATVRMGEMTLQVHLIRSTVCTLTVRIDSPESLAGMEICADGNSATISYLGLSYTVKYDDISNAAFVGAIADALDFASAEENLTVERSDGQYRFCGRGSYGDFSITTFSDGTISTLSIPSMDLTVDFLQHAQ